MSCIRLLHGSDHVINNPQIGLGNPQNDYGPGFYCTRSLEMAREWACKKGTNGFVNIYKIDMGELSILNLMDDEYTILNWIAILLKNRLFHMDSEIAQEARDYIIEHFAPNVANFDVVVGYRADDSYFRYAESFVSNTLPLRSLNQAMRLGKLGEQTVIISQKGFDSLDFIKAEKTESNIYYNRFKSRDDTARKTYKEEIKKSHFLKDDIFVLDIIREGVENNDPRIQRILSE